MAEQKSTKISRRRFLEVAAITGAASVAAACATPTPQVIKETVVVKETVPVEKVVKETVVTEKEVTKVVEKVATQIVEKEKVITATPAPSKQSANQTYTYLSTGGGFGYFPTGAGAAERTFLGSVYTPPLMMDKDSKVSPGLLASAESDDGKMWTLKVDPKAKWSDGSKITATDLKQGWEYNNEPQPVDVQQLTKLNVLVNILMANIKGQQEHNAGTEKEITGVQVVDDASLRYRRSRHTRTRFPSCAA